MGGMTSPRRVSACLVGTRGSLNAHRISLESTMRQFKVDLLFSGSMERGPIPLECGVSEGFEVEEGSSTTIHAHGNHRTGTGRIDAPAWKATCTGTKRRQRRSPKGRSLRGGGSVNHVGQRGGTGHRSGERGMKTKSR